MSIAVQTTTTNRRLLNLFQQTGLRIPDAGICLAGRQSSPKNEGTEQDRASSASSPSPSQMHTLLRFRRSGWVPSTMRVPEDHRSL